MRLHKNALIDTMLEKCSHYINMRNAAHTPARRKYYHELAVMFGALAHAYAEESEFNKVSAIVAAYSKELKNA